MRLLIGLLCLLLPWAYAKPAGAGYSVQNAVPSLTFSQPVDIQHAGDGSDRLFVVQQNGIVWVFDNDPGASSKRVFLDISAKVTSSGESGLLGLAFSPDYATNGSFYVFYVSKLPYHSVVARYQVTSDPDSADATSEAMLFALGRGSLFHGGGQLAFGGDGMLYISLGDDTNSGNAQNRFNMYGALLRIDAENPPGGTGYGIPPDNPFAGNTDGYREEIYAYGFRNPWRFSIDPVTQQIWLGDVGQNLVEEVDVVVPGGNYGWPLMEGPDCYSPPSCDTAGTGVLLPVYAYGHNEGSAVIGGHVYRGSAHPELVGRYLFGDYTGTRLWSLFWDGINEPNRVTLVNNVPWLRAFGVDEEGEFYFAGNNGLIYTLASTPTGVAGAPPPAAAWMGASYPNPFNPQTTIPYGLSRAGTVDLLITDARGARVRALVSGPQSAGEHAARWDGADAHGRPVASGVYFARLLLDGEPAAVRRLVLVR